MNQSQQKMLTQNRLILCLYENRLQCQCTDMTARNIAEPKQKMTNNLAEQIGHRIQVRQDGIIRRPEVGIWTMEGNQEQRKASAERNDRSARNRKVSAIKDDQIESKERFSSEGNKEQLSQKVV
jgi:hypothetical protein